MSNQPNEHSWLGQVVLGLHLRKLLHSTVIRPQNCNHHQAPSWFENHSLCRQMHRLSLYHEHRHENNLEPRWNLGICKNMCHHYCTRGQDSLRQNSTLPRKGLELFGLSLEPTIRTPLQLLGWKKV